MTPLDWALRYAAAGWRVYPVERGCKKALFTGWQRDATTDPELIARHWRHEPFPNIGVICGEGLAAFDIEAPHLPRFFAHVAAAGSVLPETAVCSTGRGGLHIYVKPIPGLSTTRQLRINGVHVGEYKTTGGVLAPPSVTVGPYRWLWWPDDPMPAESPDWLSAVVAEPAQAPSKIQRALAVADPAAALDALACAVRDEPEGNRNSLLFWAACRAVEEGIRSDIAETVLRRAASAAGLHDGEIDATIASAFARLRVPA